MDLCKIDFHFHTCFSIDSLTQVERLPELIERIGLDKLAITDHNTISGALAARKLVPDKIIVGEEVKTTRGELLIYYLESTIPSGLAPEETIALAREQGAIVSVAHPFDTRRGGWQRQDLDAIAPMLDAVEVFNSRTLIRKFNNLARDFAYEHHLTGTAGSDGHTARELGRAYTTLPGFNSPDELKLALKSSVPSGKTSGVNVMFSSTAARLYKRLRS